MESGAMLKLRVADSAARLKGCARCRVKQHRRAASHRGWPIISSIRRDQPLAGSFCVAVLQAMHGATPGADVSSGVCANCQIAATALKMQSTKTTTSRTVRPFSCELTSRL